MRLSICFSALAALVNAGLYIPTTLQSIFELNSLWPGKPKVPQFILDTNHPWLATNQKWLDRYPDVRSAICTKTSDLWTNPSTPERALPPDLFTNIIIDNNKYGVSRFGWKNFDDRLEELDACPAALRDVRNLHIEIYVHDSDFDTWKESTFPPASLYPFFAETLLVMPHLEKLHWGVKPQVQPGFEGAFARANVTLPSVKRLVVRADDAWLVRRCTQLEHLTAPAHVELVTATAGLKLQSISMANSGWPRATWWDLLEALFATQPDIPGINMDGELFDGAKWMDEPDKFEEHLGLLSRFDNLTSLALPSAFLLGLGFDGGPGCGNAYFGAEGRKYRRQVTRAGLAVMERAGNMTVKLLPGLRKLSIGGTRGNITVDGEGKVHLVWPWTGRLKEYTYEVWPDRDDDFEHSEL